jgi:hypothetical protein
MLVIFEPNDSYESFDYADDSYDTDRYLDKIFFDSSYQNIYYHNSMGVDVPSAKLIVECKSE